MYEMMSMDSIVNLIAQLNTSKDKRSYSNFGERIIEYGALEAMYRNDWVSGKVVDLPVQDATRKWRQIVSESVDAEKIDMVKASEEDLGFRDAVIEAMLWARLYGGAGIVLGIDDADPSEPLDVENVKQGDLKYLHVFDRHDLQVMSVNQTDPYSETFRKPETYVVAGSQQPIHASRILIFDGRALPWRLRERNDYWGESWLAHVYDAILHSQGTVSAIAALPYKAVVDVIAVSGFFQSVATGGKSVSDFVQRFEAADQIKSINNALVIDKEKEDIRQQAIQFTGLSDIVQRFMNIVAAASDIPATRFLGESAPGLNSAGQMELRNYYDSISALQNSKLRSVLRKWDEIHVRSVLGEMPDDWTFYFEPLWQASELEQAQTELTRAQRDQVYMQNGVLLPGQIAGQLRLDGTYETIDAEYLDVLNEIDEEEQAAEKERRENPEPEVPEAPDLEAPEPEENTETEAEAEPEEEYPEE